MSDLKDFIIKDGVLEKYVGKGGDVVITEGVEVIKENAFKDHQKIKSITIPNSVTKIETNALAFSGLNYKTWKFETALTKVMVLEDNPNYKSIEGNLYSKDGTMLIRYMSGKNDRSFVIPDGVTTIGEYAFGSCSNLTNIVISDNVTVIESHAFSACSSLTNIVIPNSVITIGEGAFSGCSNLANIVIPNGVKTIGDDAFNCCSSLTNIVISDNVTVIGNHAFSDCFSLTNIVIPNRVKKIGDYAFDGCSSLYSLIIPKSVESIGYDAFTKCEGLTIYCEAEIQPSTWERKWNDSWFISLDANAVRELEKCPVVWNCKQNDIAEDGFLYVHVDDIRYGIKDGEAIVARQPRGFLDTEANIPSKFTYNDTVYEVTGIEGDVFANSVGLEKLCLPDTIDDIGQICFAYCPSLRYITLSQKSLESLKSRDDLFGERGKSIYVNILRDGKDPIYTICAFRRMYWKQSFDYTEEFLAPYRECDIPNYDTLLAVGNFEGFKMSEEWRLRAMILRLQQVEFPVEDDFREIFIEFLKEKITKLIKIANEDKDPTLIRIAIETGCVTEENKKKVTNALKKSEMDEIKELVNLL